MRQVWGPLTARVIALCDDAVAQGDDALAFRAAGVRATLEDPLRVAIAGRVNAGKSTLVNALLRRRVAPTRATECTQFATWYRYDALERVEIRLKDGTTQFTRLDRDGRLPTTLGIAPVLVDRLDVYLSESVLRDLVLIDTPGLASLNQENSDRTEALLAAAEFDGGQTWTDRSVAAAGRAEAIIFVFSTALRADEREVLSDFRSVSATVAHHSPVNALGVLSKVDLLVDSTEDPWPAAEQLATKFARRLTNELAGMYPVNALAAETVDGGAFTEADADDIAALAALDGVKRQSLFMTVDRFRTRDAPIDEARRASLLERLALGGIHEAIEGVAAGDVGAAALRATLLHRSRVGELRTALMTVFARRADTLKATWALGSLGRLAYDPNLSAQARGWIGDQVEAVTFEPTMHAIAVLEALSDVASAKAHLPSELDSALRSLVDGTTPAERVGLETGASPGAVDDEARRLGEAFATFAFSAFPVDAHVARVGARACHLITRSLAGHTGAPDPGRTR